MEECEKEEFSVSSFLRESEKRGIAVGIRERLGSGDAPLHGEKSQVRPRSEGGPERIEKSPAVKGARLERGGIIANSSRGSYHLSIAIIFSDSVVRTANADSNGVQGS